MTNCIKNYSVIKSISIYIFVFHFPLYLIISKRRFITDPKKPCLFYFNFNEVIWQTSGAYLWSSKKYYFGFQSFQQVPVQNSTLEKGIFETQKCGESGEYEDWNVNYPRKIC
jgi:hypothetical protein